MICTTGMLYHQPMIMQTGIFKSLTTFLDHLLIRLYPTVLVLNLGSEMMMMASSEEV
eukprot:SAG31_NODE_2942_length_4878_cov_6.517263_8_plen_57_part_00